MSVRAVVMAAGKGKRMNSDTPKVLFEVAGRPLVSWVVDAVAAAGIDEITVVVGHGARAVADSLPEGVRTALQSEQLGTGHAVATALETMGDVTGDTVLVVPGDTPLLRPESLRGLLDARGAADAALLTAEVPDPTGYGRVIRDGDRVEAVVEERDATDAQRAITEVAVSTYAFDGAALAAALVEIGNDNAQGEYYLTDAIECLARRGMVRAVAGADPDEVQGVNSLAQLAAVEAMMRRRILTGWMERGVWMQDPARTYVDASVSLEAGARLYADVHLEGGTSVAAGATVGPGVFAADSVIGPGARVWYSVLRSARVGKDAEVGPYASLRPGTVMETGSKIGTFVETKATTIGAGSKVPHLSYMGDATIGERSNIGAGTITCNYDGYEKHATVIGDRVRIGSDTMLVAPVEVGDDGWTAAGSVISKDVAPGALGVERSPQREVAGYAARRARRAKKKDD
ncbi:MAG: bifunctional UDP-N-acetylglucosamine diphosphorylase/glucosamine-1-phosphate N-acetyltransferase GlmU [Actinobacteria bacterium]|nr:bifunctional UDP-N-acetylglucosamine diphosphorylase/glucosamine-1-phosphate N-acetyltransferase GlmU [Actinomycetota bacterium]MBU1865432.1 bifunctional UDP-N-acetylglucosamine diphosphorylase/glucosamine-1-phosphate N-acetyltransferase GlmU [Actinomycetota bacterium]